MLLQILQNSQENTCARVFFLIKVQAFIKKRPWHRCFPVNFAKFLRTPFLTEHFRWLLLDMDCHGKTICMHFSNYYEFVMNSNLRKILLKYISVFSLFDICCYFICFWCLHITCTVVATTYFLFIWWITFFKHLYSLICSVQKGFQKQDLLNI